MISKPLKGIARALFTLAIATMMVFALYQLVKTVSGTSSPVCVVVSPSMVPTLRVGDIIIVNHIAPSDLKVGDIIVFHKPTNPDELVVHRIFDIGVTDSGVRVFKTKGDANRWPDSWIVPEYMVEGKVVLKLPYVGLINIILQPPLNYFLIAILIFMLMLSEASD